MSAAAIEAASSANLAVKSTLLSATNDCNYTNIEEAINFDNSISTLMITIIQLIIIALMNNGTYVER